MQIVSAFIQNFKRVEVVEVDQAGEVVEVTGANAQGKSSILDAITTTHYEDVGAADRRVGAHAGGGR